MSRLTVPEGMVRFTHALVESASLRSWFLSLERLPDSTRRAAFARMAEQMTADREDTELTTAATSLIRPEVYDAVRKSLVERCGL